MAFRTSSGSQTSSGSRLGTSEERHGDERYGAVTERSDGKELLESDDRICATEAEALGIEPVISRCGGGDAAGTKTCLDSLVFAACSAVERAPRAVKSREETVESERESTLQNGRIGREPAALRSGCYDDGAVRWVRSEDPTRGVTLASVACDRVCRTPSADSVVAGSNPPFRETRMRRVEVDVRCEGERRCEAGAVRWFAAGREADGRRAELEQAAKRSEM